MMRAADPLLSGNLGIHLATSTRLTDLIEEDVTVLIIEDHALLAQTLVIALNAEGCRARVADLSSRATLLQQVRALRPGVVLLDLDLGALGDGVDVVTALTELGARVLVVSGTTDPMRLAETVERGAVGFLSKQVPFEQLLSTVLDVVAQRPVLSTARRYDLMAELRSARAARGRDLAPFKTLTPKERSVLAGLAQGERVETIAAAAVVSEATVRSQIRAVLAKLGVNSQLEAVALAWNVGWVPTAPPKATVRS
jgi:two-component system nitrate/nitrite response regulator NarL